MTENRLDLGFDKDSPVIICQDCGAAVEAGNPYCTRCGQLLDESSGESPYRTPARAGETWQARWAPVLSDPPDHPYWSVVNKVGGQPVRRHGPRRVLSNVAIVIIALLLAVKALAGFLLGLGIIKLLGIAFLISLLVGAPFLAVLVFVVAMGLGVLAWHMLLG